jgi:hypothetical protein
MNFLSQSLTEPSFALILMFAALLMSWICAYQLFRATNLTKKTEARFEATENSLNCLAKRLRINNTLNIALLNSSQTKNNIELCGILLDNCIHKSDILTAKALENTLHSEINHAVLAIKALEEKRAFLETKIREAFEQLELKTLPTELEQSLAYVQVLQEETGLEFASTEKIKSDVLKVNQVLDTVLLKV